MAQLKKYYPQNYDWMKNPRSFKNILRISLLMIFLILYLKLFYMIQTIIFNSGSRVLYVMPDKFFEVSCYLPLVLIAIALFYGILHNKMHWDWKNELIIFILFLFICCLPLFFVQNRVELSERGVQSYSITGSTNYTWDWKDSTRIDVVLQRNRNSCNLNYYVTFPDGNVINISKYNNINNGAWAITIKIDDLLKSYKIPKYIGGLDVVPSLDDAGKVIGDIRIGNGYSHIDDTKHLLEVN